MKFTPAPLEGVYLIDLEQRADERGFFARLFCTDEMSQKGLETSFIQANTSLSFAKGTLRGMHYQLSPAQETKLVRCITGSLYDVVLDLRPKSPTFGKWFAHTLTAENRTMMYVPRGFAHGFLTLEPNTEILYMVSQGYSKERERAIRWDDPHFSIAWPAKPTVVSDRDKEHPNFSAAHHLGE